MRPKQFYGSGVKMEVRVNDESIYKLKSGHRLILNINSNDTIKIQCVYPPIKVYQSEPYIILPTDDNEIYFNVFYWGEGYNPLKHSGIILGPNGKPLEFNVEIERLELKEGETKFRNEELFKDKSEHIKTIQSNFVQ